MFRPGSRYALAAKNKENQHDAVDEGGCGPRSLHVYIYIYIYQYVRLMRCAASLQKFDPEKWAQPLGDLNFQ